MTQSTSVISHDFADSDLIGEQRVRQEASRRGLRLEKSRRLHDVACGPTLYWLFDVASCRVVSSKSGWTLEQVSDHLSA